jgi:hypothetical protein
MDRPLIKSSIVPVSVGVSIGVILSIVFGLIYIAVLHEPGPAFYPFAALIFAASPIIGGAVTAFRMRQERLAGFLISAVAVFGAAFMMFAVTYVVLPQFARSNVRLPASCDGFDGIYDPPAHLITSVPGVGDSILIISDAQSALVAVIDADQPPFASRAYLINRSDNSILLTMHFSNDVISAALAEGTLTLFNDKLGWLINARTGQLEENFLIIDNYGGLSESDRPFISRASDGHWYMETTAVISSWSVDGTVASRRHLTFNGIARGCYINGYTGEVTSLDR